MSIRESIHKRLPKAHIQETLFTDLISTDVGQVEVNPRTGKFKGFAGDAELLSVTLKSVAENSGGYVKVNGHPAFIAACLAHGERDGYVVQPEVGSEALPGCLIALLMCFCWIVSTITAWIVLPDSVSGWLDCGIGIAAAIVLRRLCGQAIRNACERQRRIEGAQFLDPFPQARPRVSPRELAKQKRPS